MTRLMQTYYLKKIALEEEGELPLVNILLAVLVVLGIIFLLRMVL